MLVKKVLKRLEEFAKAKNSKATKKPVFKNTNDMSDDIEDFLKGFNNKNGTSMVYNGDVYLLTSDDIQKIGGIKNIKRYFEVASGVKIDKIDITKMTLKDDVWYEVEFDY